MNADGLNCSPRTCRRKTSHKETKISNDGQTITEDRRGWKVGGRGATPDENRHRIFKANTRNNEDVDAVSTGWGSRNPTCEEILYKVEEDVDMIDRDVGNSRPGQT